ncbi:hypothetical protein MJ561_18275 [Klebsiella pneumoniae]|nr:hypothetical protein MJ561_18275 [Klebsiella pneumoniae]
MVSMRICTSPDYRDRRRALLKTIAQYAGHNVGAGRLGGACSTLEPAGGDFYLSIGARNHGMSGCVIASLAFVAADFAE